MEANLIEREKALKAKDGVPYDPNEKSLRQLVMEEKQKIIADFEKKKMGP